MADVFSLVNQQFGGSFPVDGAKITFSGANGNMLGTGMMLRDINYRYNQPLSVLFELGTNYAYVIAGRPRGNASARRMLGPRPLALAFYAQYGNICNMGSNHIVLNVAPGSCAQKGLAGGGSINMSYVALTDIGGAINSDQPLLSEDLSMIFLSLNIQTT